MKLWCLAIAACGNFSLLSQLQNFPANVHVSLLDVQRAKWHNDLGPVLWSKSWGEWGARMVRGSRRRVRVFNHRQTFVVPNCHQRYRLEKSHICSRQSADWMCWPCVLRHRNIHIFVYVFCGQCWKPQQPPEVARALTELLDGFVVSPRPSPLAPRCLLKRGFMTSQVWHQSMSLLNVTV